MGRWVRGKVLCVISYVNLLKFSLVFLHKSYASRMMSVFSSIPTPEIGIRFILSGTTLNIMMVKI